MKKLKYMIMACLWIFAWSCSDPGANPDKQVQSNLGLVSTPNGMMPKTNVHRIEANQTLSLENGRIQIIDNKTKAVVSDFGVAPKMEPQKTQQSRSKSPITARVESAAGTMASGILCGTYWYNYPNDIPMFSSNWVVPAAPTTNSGQSLYIFNGYQTMAWDLALNDPRNTVVKPVLQWGTSAAGGGNYWAISTWIHVYMGSAADMAFYSPLQQVAPGTNLQPTVTYDHPGFYRYTGYFSGYPNTSLSATYWTAPPDYIQIGMAAYNMKQFSDYPPGGYIKVYHNTIANPIQGPNWDVENIFSDDGLGQKAALVSNYDINYSPWDINLYFNSKSASNSCQYQSGTTLTFSYKSGEFTVISNYPVVDNLILAGSVYGYTNTTCASPVEDSDDFTGTFAACTTKYSLISNGLTCTTKRYKFVSAFVNGTRYSNGQTAIINGHSYKIVIMNTTCSPYPC